MSDQIFTFLPPIAMIAGVAALAISSHRARGGGRRRAQPPRSAAVRQVVIAAAVVLIVQHALLLAAPGAVLQWNVDARRLLLLEAVGVIAGCVCAFERIAAWWRQLAAGTQATRSVPRTLQLSVTAIAMVSGVAIAMAYRWASSWSVVTLTPYVTSLATAHPRAELVASTPFAVRLHLLAACACIAFLPLADAWTAAIAIARASGRALAAAARRTSRIARPEFDARSLPAIHLPTIASEKER
jgi:hypothetical protein